MPIAFKPGQRITVILDGDKDDPNPTKFYARAVTCGAAMDFQEHVERMRTAGTDAAARMAALGGLCTALESAVTGWENLRDENGNSIEYGSRKLRDIITPNEIGELAAKVLGGRLSDDESKKSASQSDSISASAAPPAQTPTA